MKAKILVYAFAVLILPTVYLTHAQQATKIPQIGYLEGGPLSAHTARMEAFRQGLRELGYEEGKNITIEWRFGDSKVDRLSALATELVGLKVAVIVTGGSAPTRAAKQATSTIPIVMAQEAREFPQFPKFREVPSEQVGGNGWPIFPFVHSPY